jgi:hypothetical protein
MVSIGRNKILERKIQNLEYKLLQSEGFVKALQDEITLIKKASLLRFIYWRWVNEN